MFFKYFLALFITVLLGPGLGHFVLGKIKKGVVLLAAAVFCIFIMAVILMLNADVSAIPRDYSLMAEYVKKLISENSSKMYIADVPLALAWAYALLDIITEAFFEFKKIRENQ